MKTAAVVLSGGNGKRMGSSVPKQYIELCGRPLIWYSLNAFEESTVDEIVLVCAQGDERMCREDIVDKFGLKKVRSIVAGGRERYHSVMNGIKAVSRDTEYIFIHDGARPFLSGEIIERAFKDVQEKKACVVGMPVKDTIKISSAEGYVLETPKRASVWQVQTPQAFSAELIREAYLKLENDEERLISEGVEITDDAMIVELLMEHRVYLTHGSYENIKVTTPEDLEYAQWLLEKK